jgi:YHS domain-containing protein
MGTTYYFARPDNKTLFCMDKAYGLADLLGIHATLSQGAKDVEVALRMWFEPEDVAHADAIAAAVKAFADGQPIYFISEHHEWIDGDDYRDQRGWLREVGNWFDVTRGLP